MKMVRPMSGDGAVLGSLDDRDGGTGELIDVDLDKVDPKVCEIVFVATIHEGDKENVTFGDVKNAYISVINAETEEELCRYELNEEFTSETAVSVAKLVVNDDGDWEFEAIGMGHAGGLETLIDIYAS
jgi:stress response protein SCP2